MIVRILTARVPRDRAGRFEDVLRAQLPVMRAMDGLIYVKLARQSHPTHDDVLLFEEWRDADALYGWAGAHVERPRLLPGAENLAEFVSVTHYEALDREIDSVVTKPGPGAPSDGGKIQAAQP
ncbi:MAG TPA: antibiotic biosynthesis monooxygenase family protein [Candidatus Deferrimicrobium sp.]|nr:antibiotic biosynthesis monooxygenase family protein [Candidatus Deferrimicrobium sp.]